MKAWMRRDVFRHLSDFAILWAIKERMDSSNEDTIHASRVHDSLKYQRTVTKQINPLQVHNLITNRSVAILETSRRIMNTKCVKTSVLANVKHF